VLQIAAYLLQREIKEGAERVDRYFRDIYEPKKSDPARQWPPRAPKVVGFERSAYPTFSNVLLHVNGAQIQPENGAKSRRRPSEPGIAQLTFDEKDPLLKFSVIDGQHRINGAFLAVRILAEEKQDVKWDVPAEIFLDLDPRNDPPRKQAQIFIDVNFYQKKVDRSLVADLFPTARGRRQPLDDKERAQDLGRKLMLETGPLIGMIQIPGIRYGVKDVVTLATLNAAIEDVIPHLSAANIEGLEEQAEFLAQCFEAWLEATGRMEKATARGGLDPDNVVYQGRVLVSVLTLIPAIIWELKKKKITLISDKSLEHLVKWFKAIASRAGVLQRDRFISRADFKRKGYLGSGGLARFRDVLWAAALAAKPVHRLSDERIGKMAASRRGKVLSALER
jgi:DGQHR domain-containing protein